MLTPSLLPCPFCAGRDAVLARGRGIDPSHVVVWCRSCCKVEVGCGTSVDRHAIAAWNTRPFALTLTEEEYLLGYLERDGPRILQSVVEKLKQRGVRFE